MTDLLAWIGLSALVDVIGCRNLSRILTATGDAVAAWEATPARVAAAGCSAAVVEKWSTARATIDGAALAEAIARADITVIPRSDARFPPALATIPDPPITLFVRGSPDALIASPLIAVVGTRAASPYGIAATTHLVAPLTRAGCTIVSGLAYGIDAVAHRTCLEQHGRTVAVLGTGIDAASISPAVHRGLADAIVRSGGTLVSEYVPGTPGIPLHFPARNRIVAGLTSGTIVVEAPAESGALITAQFALDFGREVFAVPGPITTPHHAGGHALLKNGAIPITDADDCLAVLSDARIAPLPLIPAIPHDPITARVLDALGSVPAHPDDLHTTLDLHPATLASVLTSLELDGAIRDVGGGRYIRVR
ncbi:DNA-protecting protein DprA [Candidatus Uhrbacteria bacterium]|nr:DNA-protecting protein DprA [Candidatus Uhrbacteria bacterium]